MGGGDDVVYAGIGDDFVNAEDGDDTVFHGTGADRNFIVPDFGRDDGQRHRFTAGAASTR